MRSPQKRGQKAMLHTAPCQAAGLGQPGPAPPHHPDLSHQAQHLHPRAAHTGGSRDWDGSMPSQDQKALKKPSPARGWRRQG